ncbi:hypothetical protein Rumeso_00350 [Rubellimicrobium mesophilum DSM 19309]|uniref:Uncharacterized protein n=1 Tax=Rubellimicrobium mesophilum DSM 19309 TaxID=442562 RepID=A0A017HV47_9RHOB|nr:hypothetical protein [Rubellimicrobium mesophilum]EYD78013.1 hypothetical protein Rumeso_00350 [Rubellimicrobium mesophilum DSM 19309]
MRTGTLSLLVLAAPAWAQQVADCDGVPAVTDLVEPWEETSRPLGEGAIRLALLHGAGEEGVKLLVLTLPPVEEAPAEEVPPAETLAAPPRHCRIVTEGGLGFASLDVGAAEVEEDPEAATLTARVPALRFVPESTELEELTLSLTFGVRDDSLVAALEGDEAAPDEGEAP